MDTAIKPIAASASLSILFHSAAFVVSLLLYQQVATLSEGVGSGIEIELVSSIEISEQKEASVSRAQDAAIQSIAETIPASMPEREKKAETNKILTSSANVETVAVSTLFDAVQKNVIDEVIQAKADKSDSATQVVQATSASQQQHSIIELLHSRISDNKIYPYLAQRQRREGVSTVAFILYPDGSVENARLVKTSQSGTLDRAALSAVNRIEPFIAAHDYIKQAKEFQIDVVFDLL